RIVGIALKFMFRKQVPVLPAALGVEEAALGAEEAALGAILNSASS
ncbi:hypothetical protein A2U01_0114019, partial [Trifolium medium]|nr:hypothetical protein [Trifolium medium]